MVDFNIIEQIMASDLPPSMERAAVIINKALKVYLELKNQLLAGTPEEKKSAKEWIMLILEQIVQEVCKICTAIELDARTFNRQITPYLSPEDAKLYKEAIEFITTHYNEISARTKPRCNSSTKIKKTKALRTYC